MQEALHAAGLPCEMFEEVEGQARAAARQAAVAEERAAQLAEEASALRQELAARPTQAGTAQLPHPRLASFVSVPAEGQLVSIALSTPTDPHVACRRLSGCRPSSTR